MSENVLHGVAAVVPAQRVERARAEQQRFEEFCSRLGVPVCADAVTLYLTACTTEDEAARPLRRRLAALDLAAKLSSQQPWSSSQTLRHYLRGAHRTKRLGPTGERADPLYREHVTLLVDAAMAPAPNQLRDRAVIAVASATGISIPQLARLTWNDIALRRNSATLHPHALGRSNRLPAPVTTGRTDSVGCPVAALRHLRAHAPTAVGPVFGTTGGVWDAAMVRRAARYLLAANGDVATALALASTSARQLRDRAILLLGYGAALRTKETINLRQHDVITTSQGLLLNIAGRDYPTAVPANEGQADDCVTAWQDWCEVLAAAGQRSAGTQAFLVVSGSKVWDRPLKEHRLSALVQDAATSAQLNGQYVYTSLRIGLIRTALRAGRPPQDVAGHADLKSLTSVHRHDHRENLIRRSVAGQLGL